jgi:flagellar biosynthesis protein FlhB
LFSVVWCIWIGLDCILTYAIFFVVFYFFIYCALLYSIGFYFTLFVFHWIRIPMHVLMYINYVTYTLFSLKAKTNTPKTIATALMISLIVRSTVLSNIFLWYIHAVSSTHSSQPLRHGRQSYNL